MHLANRSEVTKDRREPFSTPPNPRNLSEISLFIGYMEQHVQKGGSHHQCHRAEKARGTVQLAKHGGESKLVLVMEELWDGAR